MTNLTEDTRRMLARVEELEKVAKKKASKGRAEHRTPDMGVVSEQARTEYAELNALRSWKVICTSSEANLKIGEWSLCATVG